MTNLTRAWLLLAFALAGGCSSVARFDIAVTNRLSEPVTVWITKLHGPYEDGWEPPEIIAFQTQSQGRVGGVVVPPGESRGTVISASFEPGNFAVLRIYRAVNLSSILAIDQGSPDRFDYPLPEGKSDLDIVLENGQLAVEPHVSTRPSN
jgi:hypothetical protein